MTRRWIGGVFGNTVGSDTSVTNTSGVFSIEQQYYIMQEGGWVYPYGVQQNPYTSWSAIKSAGLTNTTTYLNLAGHTARITIDANGYANFFRSNNEYTLLLHGNGYNASAGSANGAPTNVATYTIGNIQGGSQGYDSNSSPGNTWIDFNWRDADGTQITNAFFTAFASDLSPGYKASSFYLGHNDVETQNSWNFKYSDGTTDAFDSQADHGSGQMSILESNLSSTLQNTWIRHDKILTSFWDSKGNDPAVVLFSFRHACLAVR
jgi:hypothetical protein